LTHVRCTPFGRAPIVHRNRSTGRNNGRNDRVVGGRLRRGTPGALTYSRSKIGFGLASLRARNYIPGSDDTGCVFWHLPESFGHRPGRNRRSQREARNGRVGGRIRSDGRGPKARICIRLSLRRPRGEPIFRARPPPIQVLVAAARSTRRPETPATRHLNAAEALADSAGHRRGTLSTRQSRPL